MLSLGGSCCIVRIVPVRFSKLRAGADVEWRTDPQRDPPQRLQAQSLLDKREEISRVVIGGRGQLELEAR